MTALLLKWGAGDEVALQELIPLVHRKLHDIARRCMAGERPGNSLQATALVNEAFVRLVDVQRVNWQDRAHFLAMSARLMRRIVVDHARRRRYQKRGGGAARVTFDEALMVGEGPGQDVIALDDALEALAKFDERKSRVVELRFFGGLSVEETASVLKVSRHGHARLAARKGVVAEGNATRPCVGRAPTIADRRGRARRCLRSRRRQRTCCG